MDKCVCTMGRSEFTEFPVDNSYTGKFRSIVVVPRDTKHDSGYRMMDFVLVADGDVPICRVTGGSDVIHLGGVLAMAGKNGSASPWSIDCLPTSGLLRVFAPYHELSIGLPMSSFEVFSHVLPTKMGHGDDADELDGN